MKPGRSIFITAALPAGLICFLVYLKAVTCDFVLWDDTAFVVDNVVIRKFDGNLLVWAFTTVAPFSGIWIPLTWLSFAVDYLFWGLNPAGYHLTNIVLHTANVMLVVLLADALSRDVLKLHKVPEGVAVVTLVLSGLLFGIHPLRVESVAWVSERKDVLNGFFTLAALLAYVRFVGAKEAGERGRAISLYGFALASFLLSVMAKPVSVVFPIMLLVIDWYLHRLQRNRLKSVVLEKVPFLLIALAVITTTLSIASGKGGLLVSLSSFPMLERISVSGNAILQYLRLSLFPVGIVPYAPLPTPIPYLYLLSSMVVAASALVVLKYRNRTMIAATLCFLIPLVPTLAFFQNNDHAYAARYTYLPAAIPGIAIVVAAVVAARNLWPRWGPAKKWCVVSATVAVLLFYVVITEKLIDGWKDTGAFWSRLIEVAPIGRAYQERGMFRFNKGENQLAIEDLTRAIDIAFSLGMFDKYNLNAFRGEAYRREKRYAEAVKDFNYAIAMAPRPVYFYHRGLALKASGRTAEANDDFLRAGGENGDIDWY